MKKSGEIMKKPIVFVKSLYGLREIKGRVPFYKIMSNDDYVDFWLYAANKDLIPKTSDNVGKWMVFVEDKRAKEVWDKLYQGLKDGVFWECKCSIHNMLSSFDKINQTAFMIYTSDYNDIEDIKKVLNFIRTNKIIVEDEIFYKPDYMTEMGMYGEERGTGWLYSSTDFE